MLSSLYSYWWGPEENIHSPPSASLPNLDQIDHFATEDESELEDWVKVRDLNKDVLSDTETIRSASPVRSGSPLRSLSPFLEMEYRICQSNNLNDTHFLPFCKPNGDFFRKHLEADKFFSHRMSIKEKLIRKKEIRESKKKEKKEMEARKKDAKSDALTELLFKQDISKNEPVKQEEKKLTRNALKRSNSIAYVNSSSNKPTRRRFHYTATGFSGAVNNRRC